MTGRAVHVVVPEGIDDSARPSGGNVYDRHVCDELDRLGWRVDELPVPGSWPRPSSADLVALGLNLSRLPDDAVVLVDGLLASPAADVLAPEASRLAFVVLVHLPLGAPDPVDGVADVGLGRSEAVALHAARTIVVTSGWTRDRLHAWYGLDPSTLTVAPPGAGERPASRPSERGERLLCVAPVTRAKGVDLLVEALGRVADLPWRCTVAGRLDLGGPLPADLRQRATELGIADRLELAGPFPRPELAATYAATDLVVLPSLLETYGMVVTEALAGGVPVVATAVGGVPEALGTTDEGPPGALVPARDPVALGEVLRSWLLDAPLRDRWRRAALRRRSALLPWSRTAALVADALERAAEPPVVSTRPPG